MNHHSFGHSVERTGDWYRVTEFGGFRRHNRATGESIRVASLDDRSPQHIMYPDGYNPDCGFCWLNIGHSEAAHKRVTTGA